MENDQTLAKLSKLTIIALLICVVGRALLLQGVSLIDPSEGRFAAAGVRMIATGNFMTPEIPDSMGTWEVFWSKPILHYWNTAISIYLFGCNNWVPRLPAFLSGLFILWLTYLFARDNFGKQKAILAPFICFASVNFFAFSGAALSDMTLAAFNNCALFCIWKHFNATSQKDKTNWGIGYFISLGFGVLTKGPVCIVMAGFSLLIWSFLVKDLRWILRLPWLAGLAGFAMVVGPWFYMAEQKTPGFIHYFLISENLGRFTAKEFGNKYGSTGHMYPRGFAWVMLTAAFFPWSFVLIARLFNWLRAGFKQAWLFKETFARLQNDRCLAFVLAWGIGPVAFLGLSRNLVPTYLLSAFAGLALTTCVTLPKSKSFNDFHRLAVKLGLGLCLAATIGVGIAIDHINGRRSSEALFRQANIDVPAGATVGIFNRIAYTSFFYLGPNPKFKLLAQISDQDLPKVNLDYLAFQKRDENKLPAGYLSNFSNRLERGGWVLYKKTS